MTSTPEQTERALFLAATRADRQVRFGWGVFESETEVHVAPLDDAYEHILDERCGCCPRVEKHRRLLVIHRSADGREEWERKQIVVTTEA